MPNAVMAAPPAPNVSPAGWVHDLRTLARAIEERSPLLAATARLHLALLAFTAVAMLVDGRTLDGANVWLKPAKFAASIALYLATLAWLLGELAPAARRTARVVAIGAAATMIVETVCIFAQAGRGVRSHFNDAAWVDARVFNLMGVAIMVNTVLLGWAALVAWREPLAHLSPARRAALRLALTLCTVGGVPGGVMVVNHAHTIGAPDGGPGLPVTGWSTRAGDVRIAHFAWLHALQIVPLAAWWAERRWGRVRPRRAARAPWLAAALVFVVGLGTLALALAGRPLLAR